MARITITQLQRTVDYLNDLTGSPAEPMAVKDGNVIHNVGCFHLCRQYGGVRLVRVANTEGGITDPLSVGYESIPRVYECVHAFIRGIKFGREHAA
jgi:hypothetical protein